MQTAICTLESLPMRTLDGLRTLDSLSSGERHQVSHVSLLGVLGDRLVELGFTPGAPVQLLRRAPFGGPLQVQVRDFVLSLRRADAQLIYVAQAVQVVPPLQIAPAIPASRAA